MKDCRTYDTKVIGILDHPDRLREDQEHLQALAEKHFDGKARILAKLDLEKFEARFILEIPMEMTSGTWRTNYEDFKEDVRSYRRSNR